MKPALPTIILALVATHTFAAPGASTPISPTNDLTPPWRRQPTFSWTRKPAATWYHLWVNHNGQPYYQTWLEGATNWTIPDEYALPGGRCDWWVQTWNATGYGPWSQAASFSVITQKPFAVGLQVNGSRRLEVSWSEDPTEPGAVNLATWYQIWINKDGKTYRADWVKGDMGTVWLSWKSPSEVPIGTYECWVRGWNPDGYSDWSRPQTIDFPAGKPPAAILSPYSSTGTVANGKPTLRWWNQSETPVATWFYLWINRDGQTYLNQWLYNTTTWTPSTALPSGNYEWWVQTWNEYGYGPWSFPMTFTVVSGWHEGSAADAIIIRKTP